jgi:DNA-binding MarR family transcriptional regulator/N-acetylglutamate synthase-like GNAT family acetyltransferase
MMMPETRVDRRIEAVRSFNRFYTQQIGILQEKLLRSPFSLVEARVIYELAQHTETTATELANSLGLDRGYLSRTLSGLKRQGMIERKPSKADARQSLLRLTRRGREAFAFLNTRSQEEIQGILDPLSTTDQNRLIEAMGAIKGLLGDKPQTKVPYILRPHEPGDMGWIVHRHGVLYSREYRWDERFEALVAGIVAKFIDNYDPKREHCWIAERDGEIVGSVFLVTKSKTVAQLRLLLVEPKARGLGIGKRLVSECLRFARLAGYKKITLWTNSLLHAARHIYEEAGFCLVEEERFHGFGHDQVGQNWTLDLGGNVNGAEPT